MVLINGRIRLVLRLKGEQCPRTTLHQADERPMEGNRLDSARQGPVRGGST